MSGSVSKPVSENSRKVPPTGSLTHSLTGPLLTRKELASALKRHVSYVSAMRRRGFKMPGGTATLAEARSFLRRVKWPRAS